MSSPKPAKSPKPTTGQPASSAAASASAVRLAPEDVAERLAALPEWTQSGDAIQRTLRFSDFLAAMAFVDRIAAVAEEQQHHPDILIRYNKVTLTLSTHDSGGITAKDFVLAKAIEELLHR